MIKAVIVDDEFLARQRVLKLLEDAQAEAQAAPPQR